MTEEEKSEISTKCRHLKMMAKDGKLRETDVLDTQGILRLIESVPSPKAEPFKMWIATRDIAKEEHPQGLNENSLKYEYIDTKEQEMLNN